MNASTENIPDESKEKATNGEVNGDKRIKLKIKHEICKATQCAVHIYLIYLVSPNIQ